MCTDMMKQASALSKRPHILVCTPGRLVDHLRSSDVIDLSRIKFLVWTRAGQPSLSALRSPFLTLIQHPDHAGLTASLFRHCVHSKWQVLDEADRLLDDSFGSEMECILGAVSEKRQTLLFSATMTQNLRTLRDLSMEDAFCFDAGGARYVACLNVVVPCLLLRIIGVACGHA